VTPAFATTGLERLIAAERHRERRALRQAASCAILVASASVLLLGLSGWFITAAAFAGAAGPLVAQGFNYMLPSATIRLLAIVRTGARYGERMASHAAALGALARLRPIVFRAITTMPVTRALALSLGELSARMVQDINTLEARFVRLSAPWSAAGGAGSALALLLLGGWTATAATFVCLAAIMVCGDRLAKKMMSRGQAVQVAAGCLKETFGAMAGAAAELRCYDLEGWAAERIDAESRALGEAQEHHAFGAAWFEMLQAVGIGIAATTALLLSSPAGSARAAMTALAAAMAIDGLAPFMRDLVSRSAVDEAGARLDDILGGSTGGVSMPVGVVDPATGLSVGRCRHLEPGVRVVITGASGSGKTSLIEAMVGLRPMSLGRIAIKGKDLSELPPAVARSFFAWAPQDATLLAGTVRENLLLADADAGDGELWRALHDATIDARIAALPGGLDGWIGEDGVGLSGGERRRLSLARAYLVRAPWLLLDEPTEGLDAETESLVVERLAARLDRTGQGLLLASHRLRPHRLCNQSIGVEMARDEGSVPEKPSDRAPLARTRF
jgi:ATP-binding cassette subfamily C protein CydC